MKVRPRLLLVLCGLVPTLVAAVLCLYRPSFFSGLESRVYDTLVRSSPTRPPSGRVVIVDVDERSLSAVGQWPWRRDLIARLIDRLRDLGASTIALDIIFAEPDRYEGTGLVPDAVLADALGGGRVVLGYALTFDGPRLASTACPQHPLGLAIVRRGDQATDDPFFRATGAVCSLPILTQAAGASGFLNAAPDPDGIFRRVPLLMEFGGRVYPSLALAAVAAARGTPRHGDARGQCEHLVAHAGRRCRGAARRQEQSAVALPRGQAHLPVRLGRGRAEWRGARRTRSRTRSCSSERPRSARAKSSRRRSIRLFTGVEVQATVADNLLQRDFIRRPEDGVVLETLAVIALGVLSIAAGRAIRRRVGRARRCRGRGGPVGRRRRADVDQRRLPVAALSDARRDRRARGDDHGAVDARARPRGSGRPGKDHRAASDGPGAAVAGRRSGTSRPAGTRGEPSSTRGCSPRRSPPIPSSATI